MKEQWIIDYLESEADPALWLEMKRELAENWQAQQELNDLKETKESLENFSGELPELSEDFFEQMHEKIMAQVEQKEILPVPQPTVLSKIKRPVTAASAFLAIFLAVVVQTPLTSENSTHLAQKQAFEEMVILAMQDPQSLAQLTSYQGASDFFVDAASENFDDLSIHQFQKVMGP
ncbi:MAG: hypothetical protein LW875_05770 [Proteobacteria bacterium]|nr:hypothetical protein [Pseudomonadota bacterium]